MPTDADKLIYQNCNTYRLHADKLRWALLGGYVVFLAALVGLSRGNNANVSLDDPRITFLSFFLSFAYLGILAVQNWFYNLFSQWVGECENRLINGERLRGMGSFAKERGRTITPYHPAFFLALLLVGLVAYYFGVLTLSLVVPQIVGWVDPYQVWAWLVGMILYFTILHLFFRKWNSMIYEPIIVKLSNLYKKD